MDSIININLYLQYLTHCLKLGIYANKGTTDNELLEKSINTFNTYKDIESKKEITEKEKIYLRKELKRLNLILKINPDGTAVNVRDKECQLRLASLQPHPSLINNDLNSMLSHAADNQIKFLTGIPFTFLVKEGKYQNILWQYTRALFFISQMLIIGAGSDLYDSSSRILQECIEILTQVETDMKIDETLSVDNFLNKKLLNPNVLSKANLQGAKEEIGEILSSTGLQDNGPLNKIINSITEKLGNVDSTEGGLNILGIAGEIINDIKDEFSGDSSMLNDTKSGIDKIFGKLIGDMQGDDSKEGEQLKNLQGLADMISNANPEQGLSNEQQNAISELLGGLVGEDDIKDTFLTGDGNLNLEKVQDLITKHIPDGQ